MPRVESSARDRSVVEHMLQYCDHMDFSLVWKTAMQDVPIIQEFCKELLAK